MHTVGWFLPESEGAVRDRFEALGSTAQLLVREVTTTMGFSPDEYDERVTSETVETAREVLFAESLEIEVGTMAEFEEMAAESAIEFELIGAENVDNVAWHRSALGVGVGATFQNREDAAVGMARRQAFGEIYRDVVSEN